MKQIAQEQKYIVLIAPVGRGRNNRHSAGCDEGKAFPFILLGNNGIKESSKVLSWKYGSIEKRSTLNSINMMGYTKNEHNKKLSKDIWNEKLGVEYGDTGKDYGNYTVGEDKIRLSDKLLGGGKEGSAKLAAVMSHEGTHYYGERREAMAHLNGLDTYSQINKLFKLKGDSALSNEMLAGVLNAENWKENSGDVDHWTMMKDGSLKKDNDGWLRDEDGMYINSDGSRTAWRTDKTLGAKGIETGLLNILYPDEGSGYGKKYTDFTSEQKDEAQKLMHDSGMKMEDGDKYTANWINDNENHIIKTGKYMDIAGDTVATPVFMQAMDGKSDSMVFGNFLDKTLANLSMIGKDYAERFYNFVDAKSDFIKDTYALVTENGTYISNSYKKESDVNYANYSGLHYGIDLSGKNIEGTDVTAGLSGKIISNTPSDGTKTGAGNSVHINYGFNFENSFYNTGIYGEYDHFLSQSTYTLGSFVNSNNDIGQVGNTGNSDGAHLHYTVYTTGTSNFNTNIMSYIFGNNYQSTMMQSITHNADGTVKPNNKYVFDPTYFYGNNKRGRK